MYRRFASLSRAVRRVGFAALILAPPGSFATDIYQIELRRLFEPTEAERAAEAAGRIHIYDGLRDVDVERALEEEFDRVDSMMFIRVRPTDQRGDVLRDPETGLEQVEDDGC
jgi:hypothetical protein